MNPFFQRRHVGPRGRTPWFPALVAAVLAMVVAGEARAQNVVFEVSSTPVARVPDTAREVLVGDIVLTSVSGTTAPGGMNAVTIDYGVPLRTFLTVSTTGAFDGTTYSVGGSVIALTLPACSASCNGTIRLSDVHADVSDTTLTGIDASLSTAPASGYGIAAGQSVATVVVDILPGLTADGIESTETALILDNGTVRNATWNLTIEEHFVDAFNFTDFDSLRIEFDNIPPGITILPEGGAPPILRESGSVVGEGFFEFGSVTASQPTDWLGIFSEGDPFSRFVTSRIEVSGTISVDSGATFPLDIGPITARVTLALDEDNCLACDGPATFATELLPLDGIVIADIVAETPTVSVGVSENASEEGPLAGFFALSRDGDLTQPLFVEYSVAGTAANGIDYATIALSTEFPVGESLIFVTVDPVDDGLVDPEETVILNLREREGYLLGIRSATMVIEDNDTGPLPVITLRTTDGEAVEGPNSAESGQWTFDRTGPTSGALTVAYAITGTATADEDYVLPTSVTIPAGATSVTLTLFPIADELDEGDETVVLTLASLPSYEIGTPDSGTIVIRDTPPLNLDLSGATTAGGTTSVSLTIAVDSATASDLLGRLRFQFVPDPAVAGSRDGDGFIWFEPDGGSTADFRIPAGTTTADTSPAIRAGTLAGTITVFAETLSGEVLDQHQIQVPASGPQIDSVRIERAGSSFTIYVVGFSTALEVTTAEFQFNGTNIIQPVAPVNVNTAFENWFDNPDSNSFGSMFQYTQPVTVTSGDPNSINSVTVTLRNSRGDSNSRTGTVE